MKWEASEDDDGVLDKLSLDSRFKAMKVKHVNKGVELEAWKKESIWNTSNKFKAMKVKHVNKDVELEAWKKESSGSVGSIRRIQVPGTYDGGKRDGNNLGEKHDVPMSLVLEVHARFENTLYGYFLGVLEHGPWLIRNASFILRKYASSSKLSKDEPTSIPVWIKFHGVHVLAFITDGLSAIATRLGTLIMKDSRGPLGSKKGTVGNSLPKQQMLKYQNYTTSIPVSNAFSALEEDNEKPMDDLVDDTQKKMEAPPKKTPRKTGIWSGRKADSPKRNVVFSPETKVHYFDRDDMEFDEMGKAVEEVEHENAYSELC
ncbi:zinc knuckle CX2CX4HX4C containing protein [Tanacetum coccineum]